MDPRRMLPVLAVLAAATLSLTVVTALVHGLPEPGEEPPPSDASVQESVREPSSREPSLRGVAGAGRPTGRAAATVLAGWDRRRAAAWSVADPDRLATLYVPGSRAGAVDVAALRQWERRGLRVTEWQTQVLALEVVGGSSRRLRLLVTDRVVGGVAEAGDGTRTPLPVDRPSTRRLTLRRIGGEWLVEEVRDQRGDRARRQASAVASTSRTSSSSKS